MMHDAKDLNWDLRSRISGATFDWCHFVRHQYGQIVRSERFELPHYSLAEKGPAHGIDSALSQGQRHRVSKEE